MHASSGPSGHAAQGNAGQMRYGEGGTMTRDGHRSVCQAVGVPVDRTVTVLFAWRQRGGGGEEGQGDCANSNVGQLRGQLRSESAWGTAYACQSHKYVHPLNPLPPLAALFCPAYQAVKTIADELQEGSLLPSCSWSVIAQKPDKLGKTGQLN